MKNQWRAAGYILLSLALFVVIIGSVNISITKSTLNMETIFPILFPTLGILFLAALAFRLEKKEGDLGTRKRKNPALTLEYDLRQVDQTRKLEVSSDPFGEVMGPKDVAIWVDGNYLGGIDNAKAAKEGREFRLNDGSLLKIKLGSALRGTPWIITLNDIPALASLPNLLYRLRRVILNQLLFAGLSFVLGIIIEVWNPNHWLDLRYGFVYILWGGINAILCIFIYKGSLLALIVALICNIVAALVVSFYPAIYPGSPIWTTLIAVCSLLNLIFGIPPIRQLHEHHKVPI